MEADLRRALDRNEFSLDYQPKLDVASGKIGGVEALLRWNHPELGLLPPMRFIPLAEETGLIVDIGAWVLKEACGQIKQLHDSGQRALRLCVNLSLRQLRDRNLPRLITRVLDETQLDALWLNLEITEQLLREDLLAELNFLRDLNRIGISLTVDNFGSAGSSLALLKRLRVAVIKIDHKLVSRLLDDQVARDIAVAMIAMAHQLGLTVVAESVETQSQRNFLLANDCDYAQGFWIHSPMSLADLSGLFQRSLVA
jgi:EAL domain-containing protein (putative c-di-GMP-specific phosphodiesterase class I)